VKSVALFTVLALLAGCSATPWKDTGKPGPWCAPNKQSRIYHGTVDYFWALTPEGQGAFDGKWGFKKNYDSIRRELDSYFWDCPFIEQWPVHGSVSAGYLVSIAQHVSPFDLCLVSINPTVIIGSERPNPKRSSFWPVNRSQYHSCYVSSTFICDEIAVGTNVPYHPGAKVFWFSPAVDHDLHEIDLSSGSASFPISKRQQIAVVVEGLELKTSRKRKDDD